MTPAAALALLVPALPVALWAAWSDLRYMRIPNMAVLALALGFVVVAPFVLPLETFAWHLGQLVLVLVIGFVLSLARAVGAGDAKFAAAMAPYVAASDLGLVLPLAATVLLAAFASHRGLKRIPVFRRATSDWVSWQRTDFPMGLALGGILVFYLALVALRGAHR